MKHMLGTRRVYASLASSAILLTIAGCGAISGEESSNSDGQEVTLGIVDPSISYLPLLMAADQLKEQGEPIKVVELGSTTTLMQAAAAGEVNLASASVGSILPAIDAGADLKIIAERVANEYLPVIRASMASCEGFDGARFGLDSREGISPSLVSMYIEDNCASENPDPKDVVIAQSDDRARALLADQLDGAILDLQGLASLNVAEPGSFAPLLDATQLPLIGGGIIAEPDWLENNKDFAVKFLQTVLDVINEAYDNPESLEAAVRKYLPEVPENQVRPIVDAYLKSEMFPRDGDLTDENAQYTIDFYNKIGEFQNIESPSDIIDRSYLTSALQNG